MAWEPRTQPNRMARQKATTQRKVYNLGAKACRALEEILEDRSEKAINARLKAATTVIERILGRIPYEVTGDGGGPIEVTSTRENIASILGIVLDRASEAGVSEGPGSEPDQVN